MTSSQGGAMKTWCLKRLLARIIDLLVLNYLLVLVSMLLGAINIPIQSLSPDIILPPHFSYMLLVKYPFVSLFVLWMQKFIVSSLSAAVVCAILMTLFATTPGKAAMGLRICAPVGKTSFFSRLGFFMAREVRVWISALGCGCLLITPFCMIWQAMRINKGQYASYDQHKPARIYDDRFSIIKCMLWTTLALCFLAITVIRMRMSILLLLFHIRYVTETCVNHNAYFCQWL